MKFYLNQPLRDSTYLSLIMSFGFGSRIWTPVTKQEVTMKDKRTAISRIQKLRKRLSCGFGRLSISKEEIIPEFDHENDNVEVTKVTMNGELMRPSPSAPLVYPGPPRSAPVDNVRSNGGGVGSLTCLEPNGNIFMSTSDYPPPPPPPRTSSSYSNLDKCYQKPCNTVKRQWSGGDWHTVSSREVDANRNNGNANDPKPRKPPRPKSEFFGNIDGLKSSRFSGLPTFDNNLSFGQTEAYIKLEQLGEGSYATVYKGFSNLTNKVVALKEIRLQTEEGTPFTAIREASLLRGLKHTNIVTLHDIIHTRETLTFVFEYVHTDLSQYLERHPGGLHPKNVKLFLFQLLRGLAFCHERRVLHRDLKPQNLLISELGELKLADFGLARAKSVPSRTYSHEVVTLWYRPPDVLLGSTDYSTSLDMWGVGCIFVEMVTGAAAFPGVKDTSDQLDKIFRVLGTPTEGTWHNVSKFPNYRTDKFFHHKPQVISTAFSRLTEITYAENLATSFLQLQPNRRISAQVATHHQFFADLPPKIYDLPDQASIFNVPTCKISPETHNYPLSVIKAAAKLRR